jgi:hypothetical protein
MIYDLWDVESGNIVNTYDNQSEALAVVRELLAMNPPSYAHALVLGYQDERGGRGVVAEGTALAELARADIRRAHSPT